MKKCFVSLALFSFFLNFLLFFPFDLAKAQSIGIKISPIRYEELVEPGALLNRVLTVENQSNTPKTLYAYLRDFRAEGEGGQPKLIAPGTEMGYFLASWIRISGEGIEFAPGEARDISFQIQVPADAGPGGYYGAILFGTEPPRLKLAGEDKGAGMAVSQQTGSLVLLQVKGEVKEEARIREFVTDKSLYSTPFNIEFLTRVENLGNVHVKPIGTISIINMFDKEIGSIRVNDGGANVLPNSIRKFTENWQGESGFGRYTATIGLSYGTSANLGGQGKQTLYTETTFWIVPWRIIIPTVLILIILLSLTILFLKLYKNRAVRRAMEQAGYGRVRMVKKYQGPSPIIYISVVLLVVLIVLFLIISLIYFFLFA
jgi:uncharacterized membrane protein